MTVLVAYASKHGSTREIAERVAEKLRQMGKQAETRPVGEVSDPDSYEALVIGSAVYYGSWLKGGYGMGASQPGRLSRAPGVAIQ